MTESKQLNIKTIPILMSLLSSIHNMYRVPFIVVNISFSDSQLQITQLLLRLWAHAV
jgi:hypothetical protein